ncbi:MAG: serine/threonine-protein phosphatase, partial [Oligoflexales bacterium]|nr:serine/threonine-protein phosphatase [Oligoflexales bacterium]
DGASVLDVESHYQACEYVGGDLFGFTMDKSLNGMILYICDITGHGLKTAMLCTMISSKIMEFCDTNELDNSRIDEGLKLLTRDLNYLLLRSSREFMMGATMLLIYLNLESGEGTYLNAGHTKPLFFSNKGVRYGLSNGSMLGIREELTFLTEKFKIENGSGIFLYTDGLLDREPRGPKSMSLKKIACLLKEGLDVSEIKNNLLSDLNRTLKKQKPSDDICFLVIKRGRKIPDEIESLDTSKDVA